MSRIVKVLTVLVLGLAVAFPAQAEAVTVPKEVEECLSQAKKSFMDKKPSLQAIKRFVDAEAALKRIRNPVTDRGIEQVYKSALDFANFLYERKNKLSEATQIVVTKYRERGKGWYRSRLIQGKMGDPDNVPDMTHFTIRLVGEDGCKAADFVVASVRGLLDEVPRQ